ncbi:hypothetical protein C6H88_01755 [Chlamydia muridarum str. Nigg]|uniref:Uncharacterized protein n=1 Tax=Chlamydia muridarum TaxID=83560 RepID=A0A097KH30_CHLMR|nr:hypothetical protein TAC_01780 [Chlamydia muridarum str. Nigg3 CMUT3-5]AHH23654.1 hypothetical protein Y015_01780 [Chlamydia muridarum str. Nigg CM972]AID37870.1 hypothetical protein BB17_01820 [Chlamydia muridarum str. Nigg 2 MCR]AIT90537.1 hypothetical protein NC80_01685 [Chlamydia muridarum]AVM88111.1 hypothetical protein C6H96_01755 [Chlamydia muridarum str. Nigg]
MRETKSESSSLFPLKPLKTNRSSAAQSRLITIGLHISLPYLFTKKTTCYTKIFLLKTQPPYCKNTFNRMDLYPQLKGNLILLLSLKKPF